MKLACIVVRLTEGLTGWWVRTGLLFEWLVGWRADWLVDWLAGLLVGFDVVLPKDIVHTLDQLERIRVRGRTNSS